MADVKISELTLGTANKDAVVPATNAAGTVTEKIKLGDIASLYKPTVVDLGTDTSISIDASSGDIFDVDVDNNVTISNPTWTGSAIDGKTIKIRMNWIDAGYTLTLGNKFALPDGATDPLPVSEITGKTDLFAATYHAGRDKWDVVAFIPGY
jgi:hypothetical protein